MSQRVEAFLYTQKGVNEGLTAVAKQQLDKEGIPFQEIDLTKHTLDEEWPVLPVVSSRAGFLGNLKDEEDVKAVVSLIK